MFDEERIAVSALPFSQSAFFAGGALMLLDAVLYSIGALGPLRRALTPETDYWARRLLLNLMLANAGLYLSAISVWSEPTWRRPR